MGISRPFPQIRREKLFFVRGNALKGGGNWKKKNTDNCDKEKSTPRLPCSSALKGEGRQEKKTMVCQRMGGPLEEEGERRKEFLACERRR